MALPLFLLSGFGISFVEKHDTHGPYCILIDDMIPYDTILTIYSRYPRSFLHGDTHNHYEYYDGVLHLLEGGGGGYEH